jgi:hypothetical protein
VRTVHVVATFDADRSARLTTSRTPSGIRELAHGVAYSDIGPAAHAAVQSLYPDEETFLDIEVAAPPWVRMA